MHSQLHKNVLLPALALLLLLSTGCASHRPKSENLTTPTLDTEASWTYQSEDLLNSSIDITYFLGHDTRKFMAESKTERVEGQVTLDGQVLHHGEVDRVRYSEFFRRISEFMKSCSGRKLAQSSISCRNPFSLQLKVGKEAHHLVGCRSGEDGTHLSRLLRDAEFLMYSKK